MPNYDEEIESMKSRLSVGRNQVEQQKIVLYAEGTKAKIKQSEYALFTLNNLINGTPQTNVQKTPINEQEKVYFYVDSFFAFLYSSFDVIAHIINIIHHLGFSDERKVSFKVVEGKLKATHSGVPIQISATQIVNSLTFKNLEKYRNCSTHRRQIYLKKETVTISETPGYSLTGEITQTKWTLCDDALTLNPKTKQNREVVNYSEQMLRKVKEQICHISRKV